MKDIQVAGTSVPLIRRFPPHVAFLWIAGINLMLLCILMPPFQVHDEFQHLFRSYQISTGLLLGSTRHGILGGYIPVSLRALVRRDWGTLQLWRIEMPGRHPLLTTLRGFDQPLQPARTRYTTFLTANYAPVMYVPQTIGVGLGRLLGASPLGLFLLGRIVNAAAALVAVGFALRRIPYGATPALAFALLPGAQIEFASVAPDASIIAAGFVLVALVLDSDRRGGWSRTDTVIGAISAVILGCKLVYLPMMALGAPGLWREVRRTGWRGALSGRLLAPQLMIAAAGIGFGLAWFFLTAGHLSTPDSTHGAIIAKSIGILMHPLRFLGLLAADIRVHGLRYLLDFIGILGARTLLLPPLVYVLGLVGMILGFMVSSAPESPRPLVESCWYLFVTVASIVLIQTAMYLLNAEPGVWRIVGVQGRYLLPLAGLMAAAGTASRRAGWRSSAAYATLLSVLVVTTLGLDIGTIEGFHLF